MKGAAFPDPVYIDSICKIENDIVNKDAKSAREHYNEFIDIKLTNEQLKTFNDQTTAYEQEINKIEKIIKNNEAVVHNLDIDIHNLKICSFENKLELRLASTLATTLIPIIASIILFASNINISILGNIALFGVPLLGVNALLTKKFSKNKKYLINDFNIASEEEVQDKSLELRIKQKVLIERNKTYERILEQLKFEYGELCAKGVPIKFEHKLNDEEEMNTNNIRGSRIIKNSIYTLEAEQEKHLREMDKLNEILSIKDINENSKVFMDFKDVFEYGFTPFMFSSLSTVALAVVGKPIPFWLFGTCVGVGVFTGSLKLHGIRNKVKAIKRKIKELKLKEYRYKEVAERKEMLERQLNQEKIFEYEKAIIRENIELNYSERKKQEFEDSHRELYREETIAQIEEKPMVLKME